MLLWTEWKGKGMFDIEYSKGALADIAKLRKSEPSCFKKLGKLIDELKVHPTVGTGHPETLKGTSVPTWSRKISAKHRLVYEIHDTKVCVYVLAAYGHYGDK